MLAAGAHLEFGTLQAVVLIAFAAAAAAVVAVLALGARNAGREIQDERVSAVGYRLRRRWLVLLVAILGAGLVSSALAVPYGSHASRGERTVAVEVQSFQFAFVLSRGSVPAGTRVRFHVTAADATHGFGLYDPRGRLVAQVQAMPGYTNTLEVVLDEPGTYRILCLEYCGLGHHAMETAFTVTARKPAGGDL